MSVGHCGCDSVVRRVRFCVLARNGQLALLLSINRRKLMDSRKMAIPLFLQPTHAVHSQHTWVFSCTLALLAHCTGPGGLFEHHGTRSIRERPSRSSIAIVKRSR